jgi:hypothetical protein
MSPEDVKKLLGGYATGTLTPEEQQALFAAALEDQELFDALAREQSLRDLLRDPAARAELLSALDSPAGRTGGFWQWLRRPAVAGLATAGVVAIAVVAVWQGTRLSPPKLADRVMVAELRPQEAAPARQAETKLPETPRREVKQAPRAFRSKDSNPTVDRTRVAAVEAVPPPSQPAAPAPPPPPAVMRKFEADANAPAAASPPMPLADARALFYAAPLAPGANAFVQSGGAGGAAPQAKALSSLAPPTAATARLGVRVSILRGSGEVDLTTVLDPGETVRLKLIPNADGFLYVTEGTRTVASGAAQRLKPFETPELHFEGSGQKQLYVMLSRRPQTAASLTLGSLARGDLMESSAGQERATYVVSGPRDAGAQQVVVPVTLTYR